jgi:hypothetical protein
MRITLFDIRYFLLVNSDTGRQLLDLYNQHISPIERVIDRDPDLKRRTLAIFMKAIAFAQDMLRVHIFGSDIEYAGMYAFDSADLSEGQELLHDLQASGAPDSSTELLHFVERMMADFVDMTSREVLALLTPRHSLRVGLNDALNEPLEELMPDQVRNELNRCYQTWAPIADVLEKDPTLRKLLQTFINDFGLPGIVVRRADDARA